MDGLKAVPFKPSMVEADTARLKRLRRNSPSEVGRGFIPGTTVAILEAFRP
jgi:hypothetical protein